MRQPTRASINAWRLPAITLALSAAVACNSNSAASSFLTLCELCPHMSESWLRSFMPIHSRPLKDAIFSHLRDLGLC